MAFLEPTWFTSASSPKGGDVLPWLDGRLACDGKKLFIRVIKTCLFDLIQCNGNHDDD